MTDLELQIEGKESLRVYDLKEVAAISECTSREEPYHKTAIALVRVLALLGMIAFIVMALRTFSPDMAFISITPLLFVTATVYIGAEKIVDLLPKWIFRKKIS